MKVSASFYSTWRHAFKLDPNKPLSDEALAAACESGTDGIIIGGTDGITYENVAELLRRVRRFSIPCVQEVSSLDAVVPGFDHYFIPMVVNAGTPDWFLQPHLAALKRYGRLIPWQDLTVEGYVILNQQSKVGRLTACRLPSDLDDLLAYTLLVDRLLQLPILYLEYSGRYGDPAWVKEVGSQLGQAQLFYGGGITTKEEAQEMGAWADTIIVGNLVHQDWRRALETVPQARNRK